LRGTPLGDVDLGVAAKRGNDFEQTAARGSWRALVVCEIIGETTPWWLDTFTFQKFDDLVSIPTQRVII
jgi:hypothetical protein